MLLFVSAFPMIVVSGKATMQTKNNYSPIPGCIEGSEPIIKVEQKQRTIEVSTHEIVTSTNLDIVDLLMQIDEQMIYNYIDDLSSFGPKVTGEPACEDAAAYIYNEFEQMGLEVRYDDWEYSGFISDNVEATLPGTDQTSDEIYIVCGHYDTVPESPGADDDSSGVAVALASAYVMSQYSFNHTIRFVAFSGEEEGLLGSYMYVQDVIENGDNIAGVLNADMIGFAVSEYDELYLNIFENEESMWLFDYTNAVSQLYSDYIDLSLIAAGFSWGSDHYYFWENGYSALFYHEYNFNDYYHSADDTLEHMNMKYDVKGTRLILATLAELAQLGSTNSPPSLPLITGPSTGKIEISYDYDFVSTDPEGYGLYYSIDWGDDTGILYVGPYDSGLAFTLNHTWIETGTYVIKAKAKDIFGAESDWANLEIVITKSKSVSNSFTMKLLERFPNIIQIVKVLLKL
jgi:hypothetical protein